MIEFGGLDDESDPAGQLDGAAPEDVPSGLRVSPQTCPADLTLAADPDPAEEIGHIQEILAEVEDEFQPAGSIQPEIDIFPPLCEDPFRETFAEEEAVTDRYTVVSEKSQSGCPAVTPLSLDEPLAGAPSGIDEWGPAGEQCAAAVAMCAATLELAAMPASPADMPAEAFAATEWTDPTPTPGSNVPELVERPEKPQPSRPAAAPKRREYERLFAKLLRNS